MENYERYKTVSAESFEKKGVMYYLVRIPSDKKLLPMIENIKGKKILDVGLGTGRYSKFLLKNNDVTGVDRNPHLCKLPITVHKGDATQIAELTGAEKFDVVFSTWMTEYLDGARLRQFFNSSKKVLANNGQLITTIISKHGFGFLYVAAAKIIRHIEKYNYPKKQVNDMLEEAGFSKIEIINLNSWFYVPWAYLVIAR